MKGRLNKIRLSQNKDKIECVNLYFQDDSRFSLITKQKRVITAKGLKPISKYTHSYKYKWLRGRFCMTTRSVCKDLFIKYLEDFSKQKSTELKIIVIDNAAFHSTKDIELPGNIILLNIPTCCPELNPAEKMWQWMKDKIAMKVFDTLEILENKTDELIRICENKIIKSISGYDYYLKVYYSIFKVKLYNFQFV